MISNSPHHPLTPPLPGHIHLWTVTESPDHTLLSPEELDQLSKITNPLTRITFTSSRSALRLLASRYTGIPTSHITTSTLPTGKPILTHPSHLHFNLSHTTHHILLAFATTPIGIDIESTQRKAPFLAIAKRYFHPSELAQIPPQSPKTKFLELWTAKEATIKLHGSTLAQGLLHTSIHPPSQPPTSQPTPSTTTHHSTPQKNQPLQHDDRRIPPVTSHPPLQGTPPPPPTSPTLASHHHHTVHLRHHPLPPHHLACIASHHPIHHLHHRTLHHPPPP